MKIALLSRSLNCYSTRRLRESAVQRGHEVKVLNTLKFAIDLEEGCPDLFFRQKQLSHYDFNVAVAEVDFQDKWQRSMLAISFVGTDHGSLDGACAKVRDFIQRDHRVQVADAIEEFR
jgi:hypothetical protein